MNPYKVDGPAVIHFSGGRTSGYMLRQILDAHGGTLPADVHVSFQNTGKEREETLVFVEECSQRWAVPITWLEWDGFENGSRSRCLYRVVDFETASRKGEPFERMIKALGLPPNPVARTCTANLKVKTSKAWMVTHGYEEWDSVMGIRADEPRRVARLNAPGRDNSAGIPHLPLARAGVRKADVLEFWREQPFDLRLDPSGDLGNCDLCFLKSRAKIVSAIRREPARHVWWAAQEAGPKGATFRSDRPRYDDLAREAEFQSRQNTLPHVETEDDALADCMCGD
ncbi:Nin-like protein [Aquamicrobium sp.]|uniref:Nin-like protein n=1 Tax=Aquamicrobium sp. TaxID=1872579 RepID=UPI00258BBD92|nr:Nin-like protein [Aquamicrobium sp.]MCK9553495.1 Nin-like protein [Aquamicrobium sp.]